MNMKADSILLAKLKRAAKRELTKAEQAAQRRSYVLAEAGFGSDKDELAYRLAVEAGDQGLIEQLKREEEERVKRAKEWLDKQ